MRCSPFRSCSATSAAPTRALRSSLQPTHRSNSCRGRSRRRRRPRWRRSPGALRGICATPPRSALIDVAESGRRDCHPLTNGPWLVDARAIGEALRLESVALTNDYTPLAASATALSAERGELARSARRDRRGLGPISFSARDRARRRRPGAGRGSSRQSWQRRPATSSSVRPLGRRRRSGRISRGSAAGCRPKRFCRGRGCCVLPQQSPPLAARAMGSQRRMRCLRPDKKGGMPSRRKPCSISPACSAASPATLPSPSRRRRACSSQGELPRAWCRPRGRHLSRGLRCQGTTRRLGAQRSGVRDHPPGTGAARMAVLAGAAGPLRLSISGVAGGLITWSILCKIGPMPPTRPSAAVLPKRGRPPRSRRPLSCGRRQPTRGAGALVLALRLGRVARRRGARSHLVVLLLRLPPSCPAR